MDFIKHKKETIHLLIQKLVLKNLIILKYDNKYSFDRLTNLSFSGTNHKEDQPCHLFLKNE